MNLNELKILLALNGGQRLPHLEVEIFANEELTELYTISYLGRWMIIDIPWKLQYHAKHAMKCRWPEAEIVIKRSRPHWKRYCEHFEILNET